MKKRSKTTQQRITSLDGKRTISAREFDRLFAAGSDAIDRFIDWSKAEVRLAPAKKPVTLRLDADLLEWFKSLGKGYQTRINAILRSYQRAAEKS